MSNTMETISQQDLSKKKINEVLKQGSEKHIPTAVILPYETYQELTQARKDHLREVYDRLEKRVLSNSEVLKGLDSVKLVRETRERR